MLILSASKGKKGGKTYYKDYKRVTAPMEMMGKLLRDYSVSSYIYGEGETEGGEQCAGHRAGRSAIEPGNVLLIDIDSKYISVGFDELVEKLEGVSCYIAPSKGWSEAVEKYHIAVELWQALPMDKDAFKALYKAVCQQLGLEGLYDPAMESWTQQLAPHFRDGCPELLIEGDPIDADEALANYVAPEEVRSEGGGVAGTFDESQVFVLSATREKVLAGDLQIEAGRKVRVHCADGLLHDGRADTAFVSALADGGLLYHCTGGRCQKTLVYAPNPFEDEGDMEVVQIDRPEGLDDWIKEAEAVIREHFMHSAVYIGKKVSDGQRADAVNYACSAILEKAGARMVNEVLMIFNGKYWEPLFPDPAELYHFIRAVFYAAGFANLGYRDGSVEAIARTIKKFSIQAAQGRQGNFLNTQNCVLEISRAGVVQHPHSPSFVFTSCLPYDYQLGAKCPTWELVVDRVMCEQPELVKSLQESIGYLMLRDYNIEKMVCFVGEGANGKTTVMDVIKALVGRSGYSAVPIKQLVKDNSEGQYSRAAIAGKLINITNELTPKSLEADAFKDLITGEDIQARQPYGRVFSLETVPKQIVAMNTTDRLVQERSHGYMRRLHLIPFNYRVKEADYDPDLKAKLRSELPGVLNWVLRGAMQVVNHGLSVSDPMQELLESVERDASPVQQFLEEQVEMYERPFCGSAESIDLLTKGEDLLSAYREFCAENGYFPMGRNKFLAEVETNGVLRIRDRVVRIGNVTKKLNGFYCTLADSPFSNSATNVLPFKKKRG